MRIYRPMTSTQAAPAANTRWRKKGPQPPQPASCPAPQAGKKGDRSERDRQHRKYDIPRQTDIHIRPARPCDHPEVRILQLDRLRDQDGRPVRLGDYFKGCPVVLVLGYYRCPNLCSVVWRGLLESLQRLKLDVGRDFEVVAISIDPKESPKLAREKQATYARDYKRHGTGAQCPWRPSGSACRWWFSSDLLLGRAPLHGPAHPAASSLTPRSWLGSPSTGR